MLLAIDTSTAQGSVALVNGETGNSAVREILLDDGWQHGRLLISAVDELLKSAGRAVAAIRGVACGIGPGSYTGTRIGVIAAKTLAWSLQKPLYGVSSLAALALSAAQAAGRNRDFSRILALQDARRDEIYTGVYKIDAHGLPQAEQPDIALNPQAAAALITPETRIVGGGCWNKYPEVFAEYIARKQVEEFSGKPTLAASVARIASDGKIPATDPKILEPLYLRREEAPCSFEKYAAEHPVQSAAGRENGK